MAELKTAENDKDVYTFLDAIPDEKRKQDCKHVLNLMKEETGEEPRMWGDTIVGFGHYHYKYESGREGDWFLTGFSPRRQNLTLYIMSGFNRYETLLEDLGKFKTGKSCLYINRLEDVKPDILRELVRQSVRYMKERYSL